MYFTECENSAASHPDLASILSRLDQRLKKAKESTVIRPADWASFLREDAKRLVSALDLLVETGLLAREAMLECRHCQTLVLRSELESVVREDGEYRCTGCDIPMHRGTGDAINIYRRVVRQPDQVTAEQSEGSSCPQCPDGVGARIHEELWAAASGQKGSFTTGDLVRHRGVTACESTVRLWLSLMKRDGHLIHNTKANKASAYRVRR
jgi:hypothetical protein